MHRTPRTIAGLVATAVLSAGLVTVSAPTATAASVKCDNAVRAYKLADARFDTAQQYIDYDNAKIRRIDRTLKTLGNSPRDQQQRAVLLSERRNTVSDREMYRRVRAEQKAKRTQAAANVEKFC